MKAMHSLHIILFTLCFFLTASLFGTTTYSAEAPKCSASTYEGSTFGGRVITSGFGTRPRIYRNGEYIGNSTFHKALDLRTRDNPSVGAFFGGTVTTSLGTTGYGNTAYVTNGNLRARYSHAGTLSVSNGQTVSSGQSLGDWSTCTGTCSGPHLDLGYEVLVDGDWKKVDPMLAQNLINSGRDPQDPDFGRDALDATTNSCELGDDAFDVNNPNNPSGYVTQEDALCDPELLTRLKTKINANLTLINNFVEQAVAPPASIGQSANTPCMSSELQSIGDKFAYAAGPGPLGSIQSSLSGLAGPLSGITNKFFKASFESLNQALSFTSGAALQNMASNALGGLLDQMGVGGAFSGELCGLMVDLTLKYLQCENPIEIPTLGNLTGGLNDLLPDNCAGNVAREALYKAANSDAVQAVAESAGEAVVNSIQSQFRAPAQ